MPEKIKCNYCLHEKVCSDRIDLLNGTYGYMRIKFDPDKCNNYVPNEDFKRTNADVLPERHGCWKLSEKLEMLNMTIYECSACGGRQLPSKAEKSEWINNPKYAYCSYCGAKMDGKGGNCEDNSDNL